MGVLVGGHPPCPGREVAGSRGSPSRIPAPPLPPARPQRPAERPSLIRRPRDPGPARYIRAGLLLKAGRSGRGGGRRAWAR